jgi:SET domain-containing protein
MSFQYEGSTNFKCNLHCHRCQAINKNGTRCKKRTCKMLPTCHIHSKTLYGVEVKPSTIPNAGLGLFACKYFNRDDIIAPYNGELLTKQELNDRYGRTDGDYAPYGLRMSENKFMDCACERGVASYANANPNNNNAKFAVDNTRNTVNLRATRPIRVGEEIFVYYGNTYFRRNRPPHSTVKKKIVEEGRRPCANCGN